MDAEGEEDDEYMHSDNGSDGSEDVDDNGQEIDGKASVCIAVSRQSS
jgi:hypothetical protein